MKRMLFYLLISLSLCTFLANTSYSEWYGNTEYADGKYIGLSRLYELEVVIKNKQINDIKVLFNKADPTTEAKIPYFIKMIIDKQDPHFNQTIEEEDQLRYKFFFYAVRDALFNSMVKNRIYSKEDPEDYATQLTRDYLTFQNLDLGEVTAIEYLLDDWYKVTYLHRKGIGGFNIIWVNTKDQIVRYGYGPKMELLETLQKLYKKKNKHGYFSR